MNYYFKIKENFTLTRVIVYMSVLFLVGMVAVIVGISFQTRFIQNKSSEINELHSTINIAGRQRMLSQWIIKENLADTLNLTTRSAEEYDSILNLFQSTHARLKSKSFNNNFIDSGFSQMEPYYEKILLYAKISGKQTNRIDSLHYFAKKILPIMNYITNRYELLAAKAMMDVDSQISEIQTIIIAMIIIVSFIVFLISFYILKFFAKQFIKSQSKAEKSEKMLKTQIERMPIGFIIWNRDFKVLSWNKSAERIFGFAEEQMVNKSPFGKILFTKDQETIMKVWEDLINGDENAHSINENITKSKKKIICDWVNTPLKNEDGKVYAVMSMVSDITEKAQIQREREIQLEFQKIVADFSNKFLNISVESFDLLLDEMLKNLGQFFKADRSYVFKYEKENSLLTNTHEWCADGITSQIHRIQDLPIKNMPWLFEKLMTMKPMHILDVDELPLEANAEKEEFQIQEIQSLISIALFDKDNNVSGLIGFDMVSKRYEWSSIEISMLEIMAGVISSAVIRIEAQRNLIEEKERAQNANKLKTIFLGNLSHEVRTPLQGIVGMSDILESNNLPSEKRREYINVIRRRAKDMQNIIEALLDMASLETGELKALSSEVKLFNLIEEIHEKILSEEFSDNKSVEFNLNNTINPETIVQLDHRHLNQVLFNLVNNAFKFTKEGKVTLISEEHETYYAIKVDDTGVGVSEDKQESIFVPFRQAHEGLSRSRGGIGLGLSICRQMVSLWDGTISVKSTLGNGSVFMITIPKKLIA